MPSIERKVEARWDSPTARAAIVAAVDDVARLLDPTRAPLGEPEVHHDSSSPGADGETIDREQHVWAGVEYSVVARGSDDGATPPVESTSFSATDLPVGFEVRGHAVIVSPAHTQPSVVTVVVTIPAGELPPEALDRIDAMEQG